MVLIPPPRLTGESEEHREITLGAHRGGVDPTRNRKFESISLRYDKGAYLAFAISYLLTTHANP